MAEIILFIGLQASGKTTFYRSRLSSTHVHISKDNFKKAKRPERRQTRLIREALEQGSSIVVDNTNVSVEARSGPLALAKEFGIPVIGYIFECTVSESLERNEARSEEERVARVGVLDAAKRYEEPSLAEGFSALFKVSWGPDGYRIEPDS
jgi:predicted kinase